MSLKFYNRNIFLSQRCQTRLEIHREKEAWTLLITSKFLFAYCNKSQTFSENKKILSAQKEDWFCICVEDLIISLIV